MAVDKVLIEKRMKRIANPRYSRLPIGATLCICGRYSYRQLMAVDKVLIEEGHEADCQSAIQPIANRRYVGAENLL